MKIALCSDLHLEFAPLAASNSAGASILILAGDILVARDLVPTEDPTSQRAGRQKNYRDFLHGVSRLYEHVVVVAGNHEFYHGYWNKSLSILRGEYAKYGNIHFLENTTVDIDGVVFIGSTMWTDLNRGCPVTEQAVKNGLNDYRLITYDGAGYRKINPSDTVARHRWSKNYLKDMLAARPDKRFVVVTHTAPSSESIAPQYRNDQYMNGAYFTDLSDVMIDNPQIELWVHGHTHTACDYTIAGTRVLCNPRGYVGFERGSQEADPYWPLAITL